ncbi:MAG: hypothetical protein K0S23_3511 [Fluviicola sp.]|jgi:hypothetical protein|uniref:hypothetical protein n=1 Tax=Fluviicola sp. TaxID=1917219 RepID=UPI002628FF4B|nr:hypothetical protein [Fluviicola sp.]MDF3029204.1 hypothetical protein [Fluviicola sp.]
MGTNKDIFVIYTTRDHFINEELLLRIYNDLKIHGNVFIDLLHNDSMNKQEYVIEKLYKSSSIVIIETPKLIESKWAQLEIKLAIELKKEILGYYRPSAAIDLIKLQSI